MNAKLSSFCLSLWRPSFDEIAEPGWLCFRARETPAQPLKEQFLQELRQLGRHPCDFAQGGVSWRSMFAGSSVRWIPALVLCGIRWLFAIAQLYVMICIFAEGWYILYYFTTWTNILVTANFWLLSLCSTFALLQAPRPTTQFVRGAGDKTLPLLLRVVECVFFIVLGSSLITCVVYWTAIYPTAKVRTWLTSVEHICIIPVFFVALISRIPYRLQHMWLALLLAVCYNILCCVVAFVPLTTWPNVVGYMYSIMNYQKRPVQAWTLSVAFTLLLTPISYIIFWFALRFNNPKIEKSSLLQSGV